MIQPMSSFAAVVTTWDPRSAWWTGGWATASYGGSDPPRSCPARSRSPRTTVAAVVPVWSFGTSV